MIVDTSALIVVLAGERGWERMKAAMFAERSHLPATTRLEFLTVARGDRFNKGADAQALLDDLKTVGCEDVAWTSHHAEIAATAQLRYGKGNGLGGKLNLFDLMVYAVAVERNEPLLFAGRDFTTTDVLVHPASRTDG